VRDSIHRWLGGNRDDDRLDLPGYHIQNDAGFRIGAKQRSGVSHQRFAGAVLLANVRVPVEYIVEEIRILELSELMAFVTVNPGDPLAIQLECPE
jgi:hypothetical protein